MTAAASLPLLTAALACWAVVLLALLAAGRTLWQRSWRSPGLRGGGAGVLFVVLALGSALLLLRPHEDTFTAVDTSDLRLLAKALAGGRPLLGTDEMLKELPRPLRGAVLYRMEGHKTTRDKSFALGSLDSCETRPFHYPLLPVTMIGFDAAVPGEARDHMIPFLGWLFVLATLLAGGVAGGGAGMAAAAALLGGTVYPVWFFRGCFSEAVGIALIGTALLAWAAGDDDDSPAALAGSFALGLAVSFHPLMAVFALPAFTLLRLTGAGAPIRGLLHGTAFLLGTLPILLETIYITAPYGSLRIATLSRGLRYSGAFRVTVAAVFALMLAAAALLIFRRGRNFLAPGREGGGTVRAGLFLFLWTVPTGLAALLSPAVRQGFAELVRSLQAPWGIALLALLGVLLFSRGLERPRAVATLALVTLPVGLYLKGWDQAGFWSHRRLFPWVILLTIAAVPAAARLARSAVEKRSGKRAAVFVLVFVLTGLWTPVSRPSPYLVRQERGAGDWVDGILRRTAGRLVLFDYHPYSIPFSVDGTHRILGLSRHGIPRIGGLAAWAARRASREEVFWASAYSNPGVEEGVILREILEQEARFERVFARGGVPALKGEKEVRLRFLRALPLRRSAGAAVDKILDGGPLAIRGPWGRGDIPYPGRGGKRLPGMWTREGSGVVGPVPAPGEAVQVLVEGSAHRADGRERQVLVVTPPWGGEGLRLEFGNGPTEVEGRLARPPGEERKRPLTGTYLLTSLFPYDPAEAGIRKFESDLGILMHRIRIETAGGGTTSAVKSPETSPAVAAPP